VIIDPERPIGRPGSRRAKRSSAWSHTAASTPSSRDPERHNELASRQELNRVPLSARHLRRTSALRESYHTEDLTRSNPDHGDSR
jgi:hypothetical protein